MVKNWLPSQSSNGNVAGKGISDSSNANPTFRPTGDNVEPSHLMSQNNGHLANLAQQAENIGSQPVSDNHAVVGHNNDETIKMVINYRKLVKIKDTVPSRLDSKEDDNNY